MKWLPRASVTVVVAASLIAVTTLLLGLLGARGYLRDRDEAVRALHQNLEVQTEQLAAALASPAWNIDRPTIDRIIAGMAGTAAIEGIVVETAGARHEVRRGAAGMLVPAAQAHPRNDATAISTMRPIVYAHELVGSVRVTGTRRYVDLALRRSLWERIAAILATDALLFLSVYFVLWRTVLQPIVLVERFASAVRGGGASAQHEVRDTRFVPDELSSLRRSIESMVALLEERYRALHSEVERRIESEGRFRAIFDSVNDAIFIHDGTTGEIIDVNARFTSMFGFSGEEARHLPLDLLSSGVAPYTAHRALQRIRAAYEGEEQVFEWRSRRKDGSFFWGDVSMRSAVVGGERRVIALVRDSTQRIEMENALREEKEFTETALNAMQELFFVQRQDGRYVRWNQRMSDLVGGAIAEARPYVLRQFVHPDDLEHTLHARDDVFFSGKSMVETRFLQPNGEVRHMLLSGTRMVRDGQPFIVTTGIDVTALRMAEAEQRRLRSAIERSAIEWQLTFDSVETPVVIVGADGAILRVNRSAATLAGVRDSEMPGLDLYAIRGGPWSQAAQLLHLAGEDGHAGSEVRDDDGRQWEVRVTPLVPSESGGSRIIVFWDVSRVVALQDSLRRSETMSAMGKLVGGVAHEVRNPLFGISATLDAYAPELNTPDLADMAATLRREVDRLTRLMRELLDFGKPAEVRHDPETLPDLIDEVIAIRKSAAGAGEVALERVSVAEIPPVLMDRNRLRQVFENLVDNAVQHSAAGSKVTIHAETVEQGGKQWVECRVEDRGKGFLPRDLEVVFEPFFTRRDQGTGLGLSIVKKIVEEHDGVVSASNRPEGGARVTIRLPVADRSDRMTRH